MSQPSVLNPHQLSSLFGLDHIQNNSHYGQPATPQSPVGTGLGSDSPATLKPAGSAHIAPPLLLSDFDDGTPVPESITIPSLSPLHIIEPRELLRNIVLQALQDAEAGAPDAESAFFVADLSQVVNQHLRWKTCLPEIEPFYAVKCNPDPYVLRLLASLGTGFDCASQGEINQVLSIGVSSSRIIFANPCKAASFVRYAAKSSVDMMTFDNTDELHKITRHHPRAKLVVRILTDDSKSLCRLGLKFGAPLVTVPALLSKARELGLDVIGVSFHVGSGCYDSSAFSDAVMRARMAFQMGADAGYNFQFLDVGGGFEDGNFEKTAKVLRDAIDRYFPSREDLRIIAEPGRFYVSKAFTLATNVIARRARAEGAAADGIPTSMTTTSDEDVRTVEDEIGNGDDGLLPSIAQATNALLTPAPSNASLPDAEGEEEGSQPSVMYYINDGVYGSFNCIMFDHQTVHPYVITVGHTFVRSLPGPPHGASSNYDHSLGNGGNEQIDAKSVACSVWGPTCDSIDCVCPFTTLPRALEVGDWLGFEHMGAYTICAASQFNGFRSSVVHYTSGVGSSGVATRRALGRYSS